MEQKIELYMYASVKKIKDKEEFLNKLNIAKKLAYEKLSGIADDAFHDFIEDVKESKDLNEFEDENNSECFTISLEDYFVEGPDLDIACTYKGWKGDYYNPPEPRGFTIFNDKDLLSDNDIKKELDKCLTAAGFIVEDIWSESYFEDEDSLIERFDRDYDDSVDDYNPNFDRIRDWDY